jgi:hypothetical protein
VLDTLRSLSARYTLKVDDEATTPEELLEYLAFGRALGLLDDPAAFMSMLQRELPQGWTRVSVDYVVRYDDAAVPALFLRSTDELIATARQALRDLVGQVMLGGGPNDVRRALAYRSDAARRRYAENPAGFSGRSLSVTVPAWASKSGTARVEQLSSEERALLAGLFAREQEYLKRLGRLDTAIDTLREGGTVRARDLTELATEFVAMADDFPSSRRVNPFFGTFDALVRAAAPRGRQAALVLQLQPGGGSEPVTKFLTV